MLTPHLLLPPMLIPRASHHTPFFLGTWDPHQYTSSLLWPRHQALPDPGGYLALSVYLSVTDESALWAGLHLLLLLPLNCTEGLESGLLH